MEKTRDGKAVGKSVEVTAGFKKGSRVVQSGRAKMLIADLAELARADAAARTNDHGRLVNVIATMGDQIVLERLSYVAWQKAFGRQVRRYAPGAFEARIRQRSALLGLHVRNLATAQTKLSQVCHGCGRFEAEPIRGAIVDRVKWTCTVCRRPEVHRTPIQLFSRESRAKHPSIFRRPRLSGRGRSGSCAALDGCTKGSKTDASRVRSVLPPDGIREDVDRVRAGPSLDVRVATADAAMDC